MKTRLLTLLLVLTTVAMPVSAYDFMVDGLCYNKNSDGKSVTVTSQNSSYPRYYNLSGDLVIPSSVTYSGKTYTVTAVGHTSFDWSENLTSVTIPSTVTIIEERAFAACTGLTSVTIPGSVNTVVTSAFSGCNALTRVNITDIAAWCEIDFYSYDSNPLYYAKNLYLNGTKVTNVTLPSSMTEVKRFTFRNCETLTKVTIPGSVTSFGQDTFTGCSNLTTVNWNATNCSDFASATVSPFYGLPKIKTFNFGSSVTHIPAYLCSNLSALTSVTIPKSVKSIGEKAFTGCGTLATVNWNAANCGDFETYKTPFVNNGNINTFNFGSTVIKIPAFVCYNLTGLTSVSIPNSVTSIGERAFYGCTGLTSATIGNSVTLIDFQAFGGCTSLNKVNISDLAAWCNIDFLTFWDYSCNPLYYAKNLYLNDTKVTNLTVPSSVDSIKPNVFVNCSGLTSVTIPNSVTSIGERAFYGCTGLTSATIGNSVTSIGERAFCGCTGLNGTLSIPNSVTTIGYETFRYCSSLTKLNIGSSLTEIDNYSFADCTGLSTITIPASLTHSGYDAFYNCTGLNRVNISDIVAWCNIDFDSELSNPLYYAKNLYLNGTKVTNLSIPNSVTNIKQYSFYNCTPLTSVTIPNSVTTIGTRAFHGCQGLTSATFGNSLEKIGRYAFTGCIGLSSVNIPNSVTTIDYYAFADCSGMNVLTIPNSVTTIGYYSFAGCTALTSIRSKIISPQSVNSSSPFYGVPTDPCTVYIPVGTLSDYQATSPWSSFAHFVEVDYALIDRLDVNSDGWVSSADVTMLYDYLLGESAGDFPEGDVDGDGYITSADITAIYNMLLGL